MITVFDEGSIKLDVDILDILGIPNPTLDREPSLGKVELPSEFDAKMRLFWLWIKDNRVLVALICLGVLIGLLGLKKG